MARFTSFPTKFLLSFGRALVVAGVATAVLMQSPVKPSEVTIGARKCVFAPPPANMCASPVEEGQQWLPVA